MKFWEGVELLGGVESVAPPKVTQEQGGCTAMKSCAHPRPAASCRHALHAAAMPCTLPCTPQRPSEAEDEQPNLILHSDCGAARGTPVDTILHL